MVTPAIILLAVLLLGAALRTHKRARADESIQRIAVKAFVLTEKEPNQGTKENTVAKKDTFGVTIDVIKFVRIMLNDPQTREMVYSAVRQGAMGHTEILGAANLSDDKENQEWYTLFAGTSRQVPVGQEGFVLRNRRGDRVSLRLKRQEAKTHDAQINQVIAPLPSVDGNELLRQALYEGNQEAAKALLSLQAGAETAVTTKLQDLFVPEVIAEAPVEPLQTAEEDENSPFSTIPL